MRYLLMASLLISGCGDVLLQPGEYRVSSFFVQDDYLGQSGNEIIDTWVISEDNGSYSITISGTVKDARGEISESSISVYNEIENQCDGKTTFSSVITPYDNINTKFTGTSSLEIETCEGFYSLTKTHLIGEIK